MKTKNFIKTNPAEKVLPRNREQYLNGIYIRPVEKNDEILKLVKYFDWSEKKVCEKLITFALENLKSFEQLAHLKKDE